MAEVVNLETLEQSLTTAGTQTIALAGGDDGLVPGTQDYLVAFTSLLRVPDLNILCLPGQQWPAPGGGGGNAVVDAAIAHCQTMKNRMLIIDPPPAAELASEQAITDLGLPTKTYSALYYPWVRVSNPYYHPETNPGAPRTLLAPPCAFAAGIWAKTDQRRGVWKAPAGVETALLGVAGLEFVVEDAEQGFRDLVAQSPSDPEALIQLGDYLMRKSARRELDEHRRREIEGEALAQGGEDAPEEREALQERPPELRPGVVYELAHLGGLALIQRDVHAPFRPP